MPFYRQIADMVLGGISAGSLAPGERLPTIRDLAVQLGVNPNTVVKAYSELQALGVVDTQQGSGVFIKAQPPRTFSGDERRRAVETICRDFVGRAQLLGVSMAELVECLRRMQGHGRSAHATTAASDQQSGTADR